MNRTNVLLRAGLLALLVLSIIAGLWIWHTISPVSLCRNLSCVNIPDRLSYHLKEVYSDGPSVYRALYTSDKRYIRIEAHRTGAKDAKRELDISVTRMKAMFEKAPAPYPGELSDTIVCDPTYAPIYHETKRPDGTILRYFDGYLNNRMTFGSCSQSEIAYTGSMAFLYCPATSLNLRVEMITPINNGGTIVRTPNQEIASVECGSR